MKEILEKIKKKLDEIDDNMQFGEDDFWNEEEIIYAIRKIIQKHEEQQANKTEYERVKEERDELKERLGELNKFLKAYPAITDNKLVLLYTKKYLMEEHLCVLNQLLEDFARANGRDK